MLYYHVIIDDFRQSGRWVIFKDLLEQELIRYFVRPFKTGKTLFSDGIAISPEQITALKIVKTNAKMQQVLDEENARSLEEIEEMNNSNTEIMLISAGSGRYEYEIEDLGQSVTSECLALGDVFSWKAITEFFHNNWIVTIGGTIIAAIIISLLNIG